jgi:hypothetical protein
MFLRFHTLERAPAVISTAGRIFVSRSDTGALRLVTALFDRSTSLLNKEDRGLGIGTSLPTAAENFGIVFYPRIPKLPE